MGCSRNSYYSSSVVGKQHRKEMRQNMRQVDSFCRRITVWSESLKIFAFASCVSGPVSLTELS